MQVMNAKIMLALTMIPILLAGHYAYAEMSASSGMKKLSTVVRDMDSKIATFDSTARMQKADTIAAIKQYKDDLAKIKKAFQNLKAERGSNDFLSVSAFKKALRASEQATDNAHCLVVNKYLNERAYMVCKEKFTANMNKVLRLTARFS